METTQEAPQAEANPLQQTAEQLDKPAETTEAVEKPAEEAREEKKEADERDRTIRRLERRIDKLTGRLRERERMDLPRQPIDGINQPSADDSEELRLTRAELERVIEEKATAKAGQMTRQQAEYEGRRSVVTGLAKELGQEKFDELSSRLDRALDGVSDERGRPKPVMDAIFAAGKAARGVIEYLADPANADEAEEIGEMSALQAGMAIGEIKAKIAARKAESKPQPSKAATPIEPVRAAGTTNGRPDPRDTKAWIAWANEQERKSRFRS